MTTTVFTDINAPIEAISNDETVDERVFGRKIGLLTRLFGCQHTNIGRPFSRGRSSYRSCISCGARRQFDIETLETFGPFYAAPAAGVAQHF